MSLSILKYQSLKKVLHARSSDADSKGYKQKCTSIKSASVRRTDHQSLSEEMHIRIILPTV